MIPSTKISQTILEFGKSLINQLPENYTKEEFEAAINIVILAWNAVVMDEWKKENNFEAELLEKIRAEPLQYQLVIKRLIKRKKKKYGKDPRGVGRHWIREENGEFIFGCEARLDIENVTVTGQVH
jgi:hypothetical protein